MLVSLAHPSALHAERQNQSRCMGCHFRDNIVTFLLGLWCGDFFKLRDDISFTVYNMMVSTSMLNAIELRIFKIFLKWHLQVTENKSSGEFYIILLSAHFN